MTDPQAPIEKIIVWSIMLMFCLICWVLFIKALLWLVFW